MDPMGIIRDHALDQDPETGDCRTCNARALAARERPAYACEYLGRILHEPVYATPPTVDRACPNEAKGRLIGTGGEVGPLACFACAKVALDYEDGARGYLPLDLLAPGGMASREKYAPGPEDPRLCGECGTRRATRHEDGGPDLCETCPS